MSYTLDDLNAIQDAIVQLAKGERVVETWFEGERVQFAQANLAALKDLVQTIKADLEKQLQATRGRPHLTQSGRGY